MGWKVLLAAVFLSACSSNVSPPEPAEELRFSHLTDEEIEAIYRYLVALAEGEIVANSE